MSTVRRRRRTPSLCPDGRRRQGNDGAMDEASLKELAPLLSGAMPAEARVATCAALAALSSGDSGEGVRTLLGSTSTGDDVLRRLLTLTGDVGAARLALSSLVNAAEDQGAAEALVRAGAVARCVEAVGAGEKLCSLYAGLLTNLTRFPAGVDALVGKGLGETARLRAVGRLLGLVSKIDRISNVMWMSNACSTEEGRAALLLRGNEKGVVERVDGLDTAEQPLTWLMRLLRSGPDDSRLAAAQAVRNCAMAENCHDILVHRTNAIGACLARLMCPTRPLAPQDVGGAPEEVRAIAANPSSARPEPHVEIRLMLVEALLLLCKTDLGKDALVDSAADVVLKEWMLEESDGQVKASIEQIMERVTLVDATPEEAEDIMASVAGTTFTQ